MPRTSTRVLAWFAIVSLATAADPAADSCDARATGCGSGVVAEDRVGLLQKGSVVHRQVTSEQPAPPAPKKGLTVACELQFLAEDLHIGDLEVAEDDYTWGECKTSSDPPVTYNLLDDKTTSEFGSGDRVEIEISPVAFPHPPGMRDQAPSMPEGNGETLHRVDRVLSRKTSPAGLLDDGAASKGTKTMTFLVIFCDYNDASVTYTDEADARAKLYGNDGNDVGSFAHLIKTASYGRLIAPENQGTFVRVNMGTNWVGTTGCPYRSISSTAMQKVKEQHGIEPNSFVYRQFLIPNQPNGGCTWGGLASVGCGHYSKLPNAGCTAWYRTSSVFAWTHELGHNLGLSHASGPRRGTYVEYGDPQASMGASYTFSSFTASARHQAGLLLDAPGEAGTWTPGMGAFTLQTLSRDKGCCGADYIGVRFPCPTCVSRVPNKPSGGHIWVQFRGDEGYSSYRLPKQYQNKVYVHLHRAYYSVTRGRGSEVWATLDAGGSYTSPAGAIYVCAIEGDVANVAIGSSVAEAQQQCLTKTTTTTTSTTTTTTPKPKPTCAWWQFWC